MAKKLHRLVARTVATLTRPGRYADGGNGYLVIGTDGSRRWTCLYELDGRQHEAGLGSVNSVPLTKARKLFAECRAWLAEGKDPITERQAIRRRQQAHKTFGQCMTEYIESKRPGWRPTTVKGWENSIKHVKPLWEMPVDKVDAAAVLGTLKPIWNRIPRGAPIVRYQIENILDYAKAHGLRSGDNPASWRGNLKQILPARAI